jgi:hypothetical protein
MDLDNPAADMPGLGIPGDVIADFEAFSHLILPNLLRYPVQQIAALTEGRAEFVITFQKEWTIRVELGTQVS